MARARSPAVTLDVEAVQRLTPTAALADAVPLGGAQGRVDRIEVDLAKDGSATVTVAHEFTGQNDLARRLEDLAGATRALRDPAISHTRGFFGAKDSIALTVDLRDLSTGIRSDADVAQALVNGGLDVNAVNKELRDELDSSLSLTVAVHAPGGETKTAQLQAGDQATVSASSSDTYTSRIVLLVVGVALLVLAAVLTAASLARARRRRCVASLTRANWLQRRRRLVEEGR